jgi:hypothetical protein
VSEFTGTEISNVMQAVFTVKLGLIGLTAADLVEKGRNLVKGCTANPDVVLPPGFLAQLSAACDALEEANLAVRDNGGRQDTLVRNGRKRDLEDVIRALAGYVQAQCEDDAEKIARTSFAVRKRGGPIGVLPQPTNVRAQRGKLPGEAAVRWDRVYGRIMYILWICSGDPKTEADWTILVQTTKNSHTATALESDKEYYFRTQAIGTAGTGKMSDSAHTKAA